jgi:hypothetical protein
MGKKMQKKPKLWVVDYMGYGTPFEQTFELTSNREEADAVMLTGGSDILPSHYGEKPGSHTYTNPKRDKYEVAAVEFAKSRNLPIIGICRGAQLLCALAGGKLVQDVTGHTSGHLIFTIHDGTDKGRKGIDADIPFYMTSLHHQMMRLENTKHQLIGWSDGLSSRYLGQDDQELYGHPLKQEPEIVYFEELRGLAFQGHPEMLPVHNPTVHYCNQLVKDYLL